MKNNQTYSIGKHSQAIGKNSIAWGDSSVAIGENIVSNRPASCAMGHHNVPNETHLLTIGAGSRTNPYNVATIDERGNLDIESITMRMYSVGEHFQYDGVKPSLGEVVGVLKNGKVCSLTGDRRSMAPIGVVASFCAITSNPPSNKHVVDEWNKLKYKAVDDKSCRPAFDIETKYMQDKEVIFDSIQNRWVERTIGHKRIMRTKKKLQDVFDESGKFIRREHLPIMEQVEHVRHERIRYPHYVPLSDTNGRPDEVLVCVFGNAVVKKDQRCSDDWIKKNTVNNQHDIWFIR